MENIFKAGLAFIISCCFLVDSKAQFVAPYTDIMDQVYIFDDGNTRLLEPLPLKEYKVGKNAMLYSSPQGRLRAYYEGEKYNLMDVTPTYFATDNWVGYYNFGNLAVLYENKFVSLDRLAQPDFWYSDSLIVWVSNLGDTRAFYRGETYTLEQWAVRPEGNEERDMHIGKISDNMFAYIDQAGNIKVFYHGEQKTVEGYAPDRFFIDRDMLVYKDVVGNFKFFNGKETFETNIPYTQRYYKGEGFVVYFDPQNRLNIWYEGDTYLLSQAPPKELLVKENIVAFTDPGNNFYSWYKGKLQMLERFQPLSMDAENDILVYQEQYGRLKGLYYGKQIEISSNIVKDYKLINEVVRYSLVRGQISIWCKGKTYTYQ
jgi:hypothetical protein